MAAEAALGLRPASDGGPFVEILIALAGIAVIAVPLVVAAALFRRRVVRRDQEPPAPGFSLSELRALHAQGHLSDDELERAKAACIESAGAAAAAETDHAPEGDEATPPDEAADEPEESPPEDDQGDDGESAGHSKME